MARIAVVSLGLAATFAVTLAAQPPADFSGTWRLEPPEIGMTPAVPGTPAAAAIPGSFGSGWGPELTITQDATRLTIEYSAFSRYDLQPPWRFTFPLDGSEGRNGVMMGRGEQVESTRAQWQGSTLVLVTTSRVSDRDAGAPFTMELTRRLTLETPTRLVVDVRRPGVLGAAAVTITRAIYRKG